MSQVGAPHAAAHFSAHHAVGVVGAGLDEPAVDGLGEGRPAAARVVFVGGGEERLPRGDVNVNARPELMVVGIAERAFRGGMLRHLILLGREHLAQTSLIGLRVAVGVFDFHCRGIVPAHARLSVRPTGLQQQNHEPECCVNVLHRGCRVGQRYAIIFVPARRLTFFGPAIIHLNGWWTGFGKVKK